VPQAEIFLKATASQVRHAPMTAGASGEAVKKQIQIKRFDPSNPDTYTLVVSGAESLIFGRSLTNPKKTCRRLMTSDARRRVGLKLSKPSRIRCDTSSLRTQSLWNRRGRLRSWYRSRVKAGKVS
jgi:hypothetical protein